MFSLLLFQGQQILSCTLEIDIVSGFKIPSSSAGLLLSLLLLKMKSNNFLSECCGASSRSTIPVAFSCFHYERRDVPNIDFTESCGMFPSNLFLAIILCSPRSCR